MMRFKTTIGTASVVLFCAFIAFTGHAARAQWHNNAVWPAIASLVLTVAMFIWWSILDWRRQMEDDT